MRVAELLAAARADAADWARGRIAAWRLPLLAYLALAGWRHLWDPEYSSFMFGGITFGIHELGHVLFGFLGQWLGMAGGSICQLAAPIAAGAVLLLYRQDGEPQRDWFGVAVAGCWLAFSTWNLATYVGDARTQYLPLLGLTDEPMHDWHYLLESVGMLKLDTLFAALLRLLAFTTWLASLAFGGWLLWRMHQSRR